MKLLLDTVAILRWLQPSPPLSRGAHDAIVQASEVYVSAVSAVEIAVKTAVGKLRTPDDLAERITDTAMIELPLTVRHGLAMRDLPLYHRDPFDRMLIAQARCEGLTIVTSDRAFTAYDVPILPA
ncbi:MAG: type II toxin-antitoxin system VapC family toxin [Actinomycetota bacterium]|nr:type II toxin-antitoxin system VapC family toxin [Actinomycetota bacterium]